MPSHVRQPLDGRYSSFRAQSSPLAPEDRAPEFITIPASKIPALTANGVVVEFASWIRWVQVEDDGGSPLLITDLATGKQSVVSTGGFVWLGRRKIKINANGTAPTSIVKLYGLSHEDALVLAPAAMILALAAAPVAPAVASRFLANPVTAATSDGELIPNSADGVTSRIIYDPTNTSDTVVWVGSEAQVTAFTGIPLLAGGFYDLPGAQYVACATGSVNIYSGHFQ